MEVKQGDSMMVLAADSNSDVPTQVILAVTVSPVSSDAGIVKRTDCAGNVCAAYPSDAEYTWRLCSH